MYKVEDIKIIPYVRFQTPDGALHETMEEALAHRPPHCKLGQYVMWSREGDGYSLTNECFEAILVFISTNEAAAEFEEDCDLAESSSDGVAGPGWYAWDYQEKTWMILPDHVGENLVKE